MGPVILRALPKLPLGWALSQHKQEANCIYVYNAGPWNAITSWYQGVGLGLNWSLQQCSVLSLLFSTKA